MNNAHRYATFYRLDELARDGYVAADGTVELRFTVRAASLLQHCEQQQWIISKLEEKLADAEHAVTMSLHRGEEEQKPMGTTVPVGGNIGDGDEYVYRSLKNNALVQLMHYFLTSVLCGLQGEWYAIMIFLYYPCGTE